MLTLSTLARYAAGMSARRPVKPRKKRGYHHGDLERALVATAVETIAREGVEALTLRSVGARVGVSRTALYRHFDDKAALLARVAEEGFRRLHAAMNTSLAASDAAGDDPLPAMAEAYVRFARANPSHYQTMFGGFLADWGRYPDLVRIADAAFTLLADTIRDGQRRGRLAAGDPIELAEITWAMSHGIATLGMARHLERTPRPVEALAAMASRYLEAGMRGPTGTQRTRRTRRKPQ
jgi:AcrR family transcriptional regulator